MTVSGRRATLILLVMGLAVPSAHGQEVVYALVEEESWLSEPDGTIHPLRGTFRARLAQSPFGVHFDIEDVEFESLIEPGFTVTGSGWTSVPGCGFGFLDSLFQLDINGREVTLGNELQPGNGLPAYSILLGVSGSLLISALPTSAHAPQFFRRGDVSSDGALDVSDAVRIFHGLFVDLGSLECLDAADTDDDGELELGDAIAVLSTVFFGERTISTPSCYCGFDPTEDDLDCGGQSACTPDVAAE